VGTSADVNDERVLDYEEYIESNEEYVSRGETAVRGDHSTDRDDSTVVVVRSHTRP
jgi:hypothetical protein